MKRTRFLHVVVTSMSLRQGCLAAVLLAVSGASGVAAPASDSEVYSMDSPELRVVHLDSDLHESFLSVRVDTVGRIFVGGREAIFVYEPQRDGSYAPKVELFRFPPHSWVYDIEIRGNDLYALTNTALYRLPAAVSERTSIRAERLVWGMPMGHIHQCMHGLAFGPEGDLYFSTGDPMPHYGDLDRPDNWHYWTYFSKPNGTKMPYHGVGGILRLRPDGTNLRVVARGTRNSIGLAFDSAWNLFSNDNDHESMPGKYVPGRLLHVTEKAYFSWPRGWMLEKDPGRADMLQTIVADMGRAVPVGQAYYDDNYFPQRYRGSLLVARWGIRAVTRCRLERRGATFHAQEEPFLMGSGQARPVGVCVGRGGRVFVVACHMAGNENSPTYKSDLLMVTRADDSPEHPFEAYDAVKAPVEKLFAELEVSSWSQRQRAFGELVRRGGEVFTSATVRLRAAVVTNGLDGPGVTELVWLAAASRRPEVAEELATLAICGLPQVRLQALRALSEFYPETTPRELLVRLLDDPDAAVRHAATLSFFGAEGEPPEELVATSARSDDTYIRQAAVLLLAERASLESLEELCDSADVAIRLAGVLAAGFRLTLPPSEKPVDAALPLKPYGSAASYVIEYADAKVDLRDVGRAGTHRFSEHWNQRPHSDEEEHLFRLLRAKLGDPAASVAREAARFLDVLEDPRSTSEVDAFRRDSDERRLSLARSQRISEVWAVGPFPDERGFGEAQPPEEGPVNLSAGYAVGDAVLTWRKIKRPFELVQQLKSVPGSSCYLYFRLESPVRQRALLRLGSDDGLKVWRSGEPILAHEKHRAALSHQDNPTLELQPGSNDILIRVQTSARRARVILRYSTIGKLAVVLPEPLGAGTLAERLRTATSADKLPEEFLTTDWTTAVAAGKIERGRQLFDSIGCGKCHAIDSDSATVGGPSLAGAGKRFTVEYLVQSILTPSLLISPVFHGTSLVLNDGQVVSGLVVSETSEKVELLLQDATRRAVALGEIAQRQAMKTSAMPAGLVRRADELRDILAFLLSR